MVLFICFCDQHLASMMAYLNEVEMPENPGNDWFIDVSAK